MKNKYKRNLLITILFYTNRNLEFFPILTARDIGLWFIPKTATTNYFFDSTVFSYNLFIFGAIHAKTFVHENII